MKVALVCLGLVCAAASEDKPGESVVLITCTAKDEGPSHGTGFAWNKPTYIVTALHVVAGCDGLEVSSEGSHSGASAHFLKAIKASDLAVIELDKTIGLKPLEVSGQAPPDKQYVIWGYPKLVIKMQGDDLRFSHVRDARSTLSDVMPDKTYKELLGPAGYPTLDAVILRVGSTLQPGHSGAPILDSKDKVVGIGDGGLYEGVKGINWAIPATTLSLLMQSTEGKPTSRPKLAVQFSAQSDASEAAGIALEDGGKLRFVFASSLKAISETASEDESEDVKKLVEGGGPAPHDTAEEGAGKGKPTISKAPSSMCTKIP